MTAVILKLVIDEGIFSAVSDSLLVFENTPIEFNTLSVRSYSNEHQLEGIKEQVAGNLGKVQIEIRTTQEAYKDILNFLKGHHPKLESDYWVVPMLDSGKL